MDWRKDDGGLLRRVSPFRYLRIVGYVLLPEAFRSLSPTDSRKRDRPAHPHRHSVAGVGYRSIIFLRFLRSITSDVLN